MRLALILVVVAAALAAAAGTPAAVSARPSCSKVPAKFTGQHRTNFVDNCTICRIFGVKKIAKEYGIGSTKAVVVALGMAKKAYRPGYQQAAFEGCLRGFS